MTFKAFRGQSFEYTHENQAFDKLNDLLQTEWAEKDEPLYLFGNFFIGGKELDALIIKRNAIIVIDFKNYGGDVKFSENGRWVCNHVIVKGGNSINPFQQLRNNKFALLKYLKNDSIKLLSQPNLGHIAGLVLFHQTITSDEQQIPAPIRSWFHISDLEHTIRIVNSIASPSIDLPQKDINTLIETFNIPAYFPDGNKKASTQNKQKKREKKGNTISAYPYEPFGLNQSEQRLWKWIKEAFKDDDAVAYYRYPIFSRTGGSMKEPDIVMLHRDFGLWVFECKGCSIENIATIQGHEWIMRNFYSEAIQPVLQAEDQMFALKNKLEEKRESRGKIHCHFNVALPKIKRKEWQKKEFDQFPSTGCVLLYEDLTPAALKKYIKENARQNQLSDNDWELAKGVLGGTLPNQQPRYLPTETLSNNPLRVIQFIESQMKILDEKQQCAAFEVPNGPQRLRGLAGTGKTVLFAKRIAKIHIKHPNWTIGFVFFTRSLYEQMKKLITTYYQEMHPDHDNILPDWTKLKVLHAWGGKQQNGFYYDLVKKCGLRPKNLYQVENEIGKTSPSESFNYICQCLQKEALKIPVIYDVLLIDEGQDLPPVFYQLAYETLSKERRLYWAYDEAQGIGSLTVPEAKTIFDSKVDLTGKYKGGISKGHRINTCYRTPALLLMTAHAINMGLFRKEGVLQGVSQQKEWEYLGYKITKGNFKKIGQPITITRTINKHPIDQENFQHQDALGSNLVLKPVNNGREEHEWVAEQVANDIRLGFKPEDILITALSGDYEKKYLEAMKNSLLNHGIKSYISGIDGSPNIFQLEGCVTISNIFRAKGNEAWKVYACRFHYATHPLNWKNENELHKRNEAFVALTRARVWCIVSGIDSPIFDELAKAINQYPEFTFPAFNKISLKRVIDEEEIIKDTVLSYS